jgi:hypothetical protein
MGTREAFVRYRAVIYMYKRLRLHKMPSNEGGGGRQTKSKSGESKRSSTAIQKNNDKKADGELLNGHSPPQGKASKENVKTQPKKPPHTQGNADC